MSYIGNQSESKVSPAKMREYVTGNGSATTFDLSHDIPGYGAENIMVWVNNVMQEPNVAYTIKNDANGRPRRLDFGSGNVLAATDTCYVIYQSTGQLYHTPPANSVGYSQLEANLRSGRVDQFVGSDGASSNTVFTLTESALNVNSIMVYVNGIYQRPTTNYTVSTTSLTFTASLENTDEIDVHHMSIRSTVSHVADKSVTTGKIDDVAVTTAKIANDAVTGAKIENNPTIAGNLSVAGTASITGTSTFTGAPTFSGGIANTGTISAGTIGSSVVFPAGHVIQVVRNEIFSYVTSSGSTEAWETDAKDLHITVTAGNMVVAWIGGGMLNAETGVEGFRTQIRFSENGGAANQDKWTTTHIGGNFTPDLYHPMQAISASVIAAHTGEMLIKRGTDNSGGSNTSWASDDNSSYGHVFYTAMEIQQ